jgi:hypothetical protein
MIVYCLCGCICILLDREVYVWELPILAYYNNGNALIPHRCDYDTLH